MLFHFFDKIFFYFAIFIGFGFEFTDEYSLSKDTVIYSKTYKKLNVINHFDHNKSSLVGTYYLRDQIDGKVFLYHPKEDKEFMIYDFYLKKGDSFQTYRIEEDAVRDETIITLDSIGSITNNGQSFTTLFFNNGAKWSNGIGSLVDLLKTYIPTENHIRLNCFNKDGIPVYKSEHAKGNGCIIILNTSEIELTNKITISPNPSNEYILIDNIGSNDFSIALIDLNGKVIKNIIGVNQIMTSDIQNGVYIVELNVNEQIARKKVIIQH